MSKMIQHPAYADYLSQFASSARSLSESDAAGLNTGAPKRLYPGYGGGAVIGGEPPRTPDTAAPRGATGPGCGSDPTAARQGGYCVCGPDECSYDPSIFCGWSALPFSTFKNQGAVPLSGPVLATFAQARTVRITAERACKFRIRGLWMRSFDTPVTAAIGVSLLSNVEINRVPRVLEIGGIAAPNRIGIPTSLFDDTFWVLPVDWGILGPINNQSRPLELSFINPTATNQEVVGVLFGDPLSEDDSPVYGNHMAYM